MLVSEIRTAYHIRICSEIIRYRTKKKSRYPNFADSGNRSSIQIATEIVKKLKQKVGKGVVSEQALGNLFEQITRDFLRETFEQFQPL